MRQVTIYTTPVCQYCKMAKEYFKNNNISYSEIDVASDQSKAQELIEKSGQMGVPVIEIDGEIVVGFDKPKLDKLLSL